MMSHQGQDPTSNGLRTLNSTPLMLMTKPRPHITLNPYSTQLVDNLNMMMPNGASTNNNSTTSNSSASTNSTGIGTPLTQSQLMSPQLMNLTNTLRRDRSCQGSTQNQQNNADHQAEVIYRSVSPHGHVYWEIDPNQVYGTNNNQFYSAEESVALLPNQQPQNHHQLTTPTIQQQNQQTFSRPYLTSRHGQLTEEDLLLQQHLLAGDPGQVTNGLHDSFHGLQHTNEQCFQPGMVMMASSGVNKSEAAQNASSSFVRTGANRFTRKREQKQQAEPQQLVSTVSAVTSRSAGATGSGQGADNSVPEQLQTQVQIRDILPIQVSVKSSEYIEAKIRTLRRNNSEQQQNEC